MLSVVFVGLGCHDVVRKGVRDKVGSSTWLEKWIRL